MNDLLSSDYAALIGATSVCRRLGLGLLVDDTNATRYYDNMIKTFANKETAAVFARKPVRRFGADLQRLALIKLALLHRAADVNDLRIPPGNRLEKLSGDRADQYSIRINGQWRLCFRFEDGDAFDVEIVDYH